jgi:hypothetical protein
MPDFVSWIKPKLRSNKTQVKKTELYLKVDLTEELAAFASYHNFDFLKMNFETKKVVHLPLKFRPSLKVESLKSKERI